MGQRVGTFLLFLGFCLVVFFVLTDLASKPNFLYFLFGLTALIAGGLLWWRTPTGAPPPPGGRFRLLKSLSSKRPKAKKK